MHLKILSAKWQPFCPGLNILMNQHGVQDQGKSVDQVTLLTNQAITWKNVDMLSVISCVTHLSA